MLIHTKSIHVKVIKPNQSSQTNCMNFSNIQGCLKFNIIFSLLSYFVDREVLQPIKIRHVSQIILQTKWFFDVSKLSMILFVKVEISTACKYFTRKFTQYKCLLVFFNKFFSYWTGPFAPVCRLVSQIKARVLTASKSSSTWTCLHK